MRCCWRAIGRKRPRGAIGCCARPPAAPTICRRCMAWTAIASAMEFEVPWLPGYENSTPVRIGNAASVQLQLDVYGELIDALCVARSAGLEPDANAWRFEVAIVKFLERSWNKPDHGIWETRGEQAPFHALEGDGVGRVRPRDRRHRKIWAARPGGALAQAARPYPCRHLRQGLRSQTQHVRPVLRRHRSRREPVADSASRLPAARRSPRARHDRGRSNATWWSMGWSCAIAPFLRSRACRPAKAASWLARSGWPTRWRSAAGTPRRRSCSSVCWRYATTWDCSPKNTIRRRGGCWATFRKRSRTLRSSTPRAICRGQADPRSIAAAG